MTGCRCVSLCLPCGDGDIAAVARVGSAWTDDNVSSGRSRTRSGACVHRDRAHVARGVVARANGDVGAGVGLVADGHAGSVCASAERPRSVNFKHHHRIRGLKLYGAVRVQPRSSSQRNATSRAIRTAGRPTNDADGASVVGGRACGRTAGDVHMTRVVVAGRLASLDPHICRGRGVRRSDHHRTRRLRVSGAIARRDGDVRAGRYVRRCARACRLELEFPARRTQRHTCAVHVQSAVLCNINALGG
mmetsp:Transcript_11035/g.38410  ORF Transcript_11035/g.38410 Transcript_11035/m.38410 type:complete len:247 (-) Transcript_11035:971-1711(-)